MGFTREDDEPSDMFSGAIRITKSYLDEVSIVPRGAVPGTALLSMPRSAHAQIMGLPARDREGRRKAVAEVVSHHDRRMIPAEVAAQLLLDLGHGRVGLAEVQRRMAAAAISEAGEAEREADEALVFAGRSGAPVGPEAAHQSLRGRLLDYY